MYTVKTLWKYTQQDTDANLTIYGSKRERDYGFYGTSAQKGHSAPFHVIWKNCHKRWRVTRLQSIKTCHSIKTLNKNELTSSELLKEAHQLKHRQQNINYNKIMINNHDVIYTTMKSDKAI